MYLRDSSRIQHMNLEQLRSNSCLIGNDLVGINWSELLDFPHYTKNEKIRVAPIV